MNSPVPLRANATRVPSMLVKPSKKPAKFVNSEHHQLTEKEHALLTEHHSKASRNIKLPLATRDWHAKRAVWHHANSGDHAGDILAPDDRLKADKAEGAKFAARGIDPAQTMLLAHGYKRVHEAGTHTAFHHPKLGFAIHEAESGDVHFHHAGWGSMGPHHLIEGGDSGAVHDHVTKLKGDTK